MIPVYLHPDTVEDHGAAPSTVVRKVVHLFLVVTGAWWLLPACVQGAVCGCPTCRGTGER